MTAYEVTIERYVEGENVIEQDTIDADTISWPDDEQHQFIMFRDPNGALVEAVSAHAVIRISRQTE